MTSLFRSAAGIALLVLATVVSAAPRPIVATFSRGDLARIMGEICGITPRSPVHAHRNSMGNMLYFAGEDHLEAVTYPDTSQCNPLSTDTLDLWRDDKGNASAQLILKDERRMLMVGEFDPIRGKHFDVERSGQYLVVSQGTSSTISAVSRPYRTLYKLDIDAQRMFVRKRSLLVVGGNPATGMLEARIVRVLDTNITEDQPIPIAQMPAGVRVLDYAETSDDLLLGGVTATGESAFVVYNLGSGQSSGITPDKPGDDMAMFVTDSKLRARLTGSAGAPERESDERPSGSSRSRSSN